MPSARIWLEKHNTENRVISALREIQTPYHRVKIMRLRKSAADLVNPRSVDLIKIANSDTTYEMSL
jgi:hypothetical protein